jgi:hypothetical protein
VLEFAFVKKLKLAHYINIGILLFLSFLTLLFGFTDLSSVALCATQSIVPTSVWMALGWLLLTPFMLAIALQGLVFWLGRMRETKAVSVKKEDIVKVKGGEILGSYLDV